MASTGGTSNSSNTTKRVVIVGAGPAGLLAAIFLLRRNQIKTATGYQVTLVDPGPDYGKLDEDGLKRFRSWMIGLSAHGLSSVKEIPGLYEDYITKLGVNITSATIGLTPTLTFDVQVGDDLAYTVDRNYICGALARYLNDNYKPGKSDNNNNEEFITYYNTKALFVDPEEKKIMVRSKEDGNSPTAESTTGEGRGDIFPIGYDVILGCDGIRSVVRNAFLTNHRDFEFELSGSFGTGKSIHITRPSSVPDGKFMMLVNCMPNITAFILPERGGQLNFACGSDYNNPAHEDLDSTDPAVVGAYFKKHFKAFEMDYEEVGKRWVEQDRATGSMAYCNFYHSDKLSALLLGDAAHATVPNLGQGMNTALADASALNKLLDKYNDKWEEVLPAFSEERVKEGNALTTLSFHTFSNSPSMMMEIMIRQQVRRALNKIFPTWLIAIEPIGEISRGMKLSEAYNRVSKLGYLQKSRRVNQEIMRSYFERKTGMVVDSSNDSNWKFQTLMVTLSIGAGYMFFRKK